MATCCPEHYMSITPLLKLGPRSLFQVVYEKSLKVGLILTMKNLAIAILVFGTFICAGEVQIFGVEKMFNSPYSCIKFTFASQP